MRKGSSVKKPTKSGKNPAPKGGSRSGKTKEKSQPGRKTKVSEPRLASYPTPKRAVPTSYPTEEDLPGTPDPKSYPDQRAQQFQAFAGAGGYGGPQNQATGFRPNQ